MSYADGGSLFGQHRRGSLFADEPTLAFAVPPPAPAPQAFIPPPAPAPSLAMPPQAQAAQLTHPVHHTPAVAPPAAATTHNTEFSTGDSVWYYPKPKAQAGASAPQSQPQPRCAVIAEVHRELDDSGDDVYYTVRFIDNGRERQVDGDRLAHVLRPSATATAPVPPPAPAPASAPGGQAMHGVSRIQAPELVGTSDKFVSAPAPAPTPAPMATPAPAPEVPAESTEGQSAAGTSTAPAVYQAVTHVTETEAKFASQIRSSAGLDVRRRAEALLFEAQSDKDRAQRRIIGVDVTGGHLGQQQRQNQQPQQQQAQEQMQQEQAAALAIEELLGSDDDLFVASGSDGGGSMNRNEVERDATLRGGSARQWPQQDHHDRMRSHRQRQRGAAAARAERTRHARSRRARQKQEQEERSARQSQGQREARARLRALAPSERQGVGATPGSAAADRGLSSVGNGGNLPPPDQWSADDREHNIQFSSDEEHSSTLAKPRHRSRGQRNEVESRAQASTRDRDRDRRGDRSRRHRRGSHSRRNSDRFRRSSLDATAAATVSAVSRSDLPGSPHNSMAASEVTQSSESATAGIVRGDSLSSLRRNTNSANANTSAVSALQALKSALRINSKRRVRSAVALIERAHFERMRTEDGDGESAGPGATLDLWGFNIGSDGAGLLADVLRDPLRTRAAHESWSGATGIANDTNEEHDPAIARRKNSGGGWLGRGAPMTLHPSVQALDGDPSESETRRHADAALATLLLGDNKLGPQGGGIIADALKVNCSLTVLDLESNALGPAGAAALADALRVNTTLQALYLGSNCIGGGAGALNSNDCGEPDGSGAAGIAVLAEGLACNHGLHTIDLSGNALGDEAAMELANGLEASTARGRGSHTSAKQVGGVLRVLNLWGNNVGPRGVSALCRALGRIRRRSSVTSTAAAGAGSGVQTAAVLATGVTSLNLRDNDAGADGSERLAQALHRPRCALRSLNLWGNGLGAEGAIAISSALRPSASSSDNRQLSSCPLTALSLADNNIGKRGAAVLATALSKEAIPTPVKPARLSSRDVSARTAAVGLHGGHARHLTTLDLWGNAIGDEGAIAIARALTLQRAYVESRSRDRQRVNESSAGRASCRAVLRGAAALRALRLGDNDIGPRGAGALATALKTNDTLMALDLGDNRLGPLGSACLADALREQARWMDEHTATNNVDALGEPYGSASSIVGGLTALDLRGNDLSAAGVAPLANALRLNRRLSSLCLWGNGLDAIAASMLVEALHQRAPVVHEHTNAPAKELEQPALDGGARGGGRWRRRAATGGWQGSSSRSSGNRRQRERAASQEHETRTHALTPRQTGSGLTELDLGENQLGPVGAGIVAEWLKNDSKLVTLGMWGNSVGVEGAGPLANALRCNTTLRSLNLGDNALGNGGESLLADAVQSNSTLVNLEFYDCPSAVEQWLRH